MRGLLFTIAAFAVLVGCVVHADRAGAVEPEAFQIGKVKVWAIADAVSERDMGIFQADPEVIKHYVPSGKDESGVICFLLVSDDGTAIIDTGNGNPAGGDRASMLMDSLAQIDVAAEAIDTVILTHMHGDHIGGLAWEGKAAFPNAVLKVGRLEHDFWLDDKMVEQFPSRKGNSDLAKKNLALYEGRVETFEFGAEVFPGVTAMDSRGHTPGHTAIILESDGEKLLCIGDLIHSAALQFPRPDINSSYDIDPTMSSTSRREYLYKAVGENLPIVGMHLPFPGIGRVEQDGREGFTFKPGL